jgi:hypothetical protein
MAAADAATFASDLRTVPTLIQKFPMFCPAARARSFHKKGRRGSFRAGVRGIAAMSVLVTLL